MSALLRRIEKIELGAVQDGESARRKRLAEAIRERVTELLGPPEFRPPLTAQDHEWLNSLREAVCAKR